MILSFISIISPASIILYISPSSQLPKRGTPTSFSPPILLLSPDPFPPGQCALQRGGAEARLPHSICDVGGGSGARGRGAAAGRRRRPPVPAASHSPSRCQRRPTPPRRCLRREEARRAAPHGRRVRQLQRLVHGRRGGSSRIRLRADRCCEPVPVSGRVRPPRAVAGGGGQPIPRPPHGAWRPGVHCLRAREAGGRAVPELGGESERSVSVLGDLDAITSYGDRPWAFDFLVLEMEASPFRPLPQQPWRSRGGGARRPGLRRLEKQGRGGGAPQAGVPAPNLPLQRISSSAAELPLSSGVRRVLPQSCSRLHPNKSELLQGTTTSGWSSSSSKSSSPRPPSLSTTDRGRRADDLSGGAHLQEKRAELRRRTSSPPSSTLPPSSPLYFSLSL
jgi:hypothetical protein